MEEAGKRSRALAVGDSGDGAGAVVEGEMEGVEVAKVNLWEIACNSATVLEMTLAS